jgi:hypothetical protein
MPRYYVSASWCEESVSLQCHAENEQSAIEKFEALFKDYCNLPAWYWPNSSPDVVCFDKSELMERHWKGNGHVVVIPPYPSW